MSRFICCSAPWVVGIVQVKNAVCNCWHGSVVRHVFWSSTVADNCTAWLGWKTFISNIFSNSTFLCSHMQEPQPYGFIGLGLCGASEARCCCIPLKWANRMLFVRYYFTNIGWNLRHLLQYHVWKGLFFTVSGRFLEQKKYQIYLDFLLSNYFTAPYLLFPSSSFSSMLLSYYFICRSEWYYLVSWGCSAVAGRILKVLLSDSCKIRNSSVCLRLMALGSYILFWKDLQFPPRLYMCPTSFCEYGSSYHIFM